MTPAIHRHAYIARIVSRSLLRVEAVSHSDGGSSVTGFFEVDGVNSQLSGEMKPPTMLPHVHRPRENPPN